MKKNKKKNNSKMRANGASNFKVFKFKYIDINKFICQTVIVAETKIGVSLFLFLFVCVCISMCVCVVIFLLQLGFALLDHLFSE